ncbi:MAG: Ig domain-containing protein [Deltaproteobacteria bacterium]|nr:Ig domain-containing protein [Deltaproteobacteria bacterium]
MANPFTMTNYLFTGSQDANGVYKGYITFRLSWDPAVYYRPDGLQVMGVRINGYQWYGDALTCTAYDDAAGWGDYRFGSALSPFEFTDNFIELQRPGKGNRLWQRYGFYIKGSFSHRAVSFARPVGALPCVLDTVGVYLYAGVPSYGNLWEADSYLGYDFLTGAPISPGADTTDIYCDDVAEERSLLNATGSQLTPLYNPYEAIQRAGLISRYYGHKVNVHIAPGEYEDTKFFHFFVPGATVDVFGDVDNRPKVWCNEDADYSAWHLGSFDEYLGNMQTYWSTVKYCGYNHHPAPLNTHLRIYDVDFSSVHIKGLLNTFECHRSAFALSLVKTYVTDRYVFLDNEVSASIVRQDPLWDYTEHFTMIPRGGSYGALSYIDPAYWSNIHWKLLKVPMPSRADYVQFYGEADAQHLDNLGMGPYWGGFFGKSAWHNFGNWKIDGAYLDGTPIDTMFITFWEACYKNPNTGNWDSYDTHVEVRRNTFRDNCTVVRFNAGVGSMYFTNNVVMGSFPYDSYTIKQFRCEGRRNLIVENNTTDDNMQTPVYLLGDLYPDDGVELYDYTAYPANKTIHGTRQDKLISTGTWPVATIRRQNECQLGVGGLTVGNWYGNGEEKNWSDPEYENYMSFANNIIHYKIQPVLFNRANAQLVDLVGMGKATFKEWLGVAPTHYDSGSSDGMSAYNQEIDLAQFYDVIGFRPLPSSPYINAGNPGVAYNDADGARNTVGHTGGPAGTNVVVARIYWIDSFVPVNYTKVYTGMHLELKGNRSTWGGGVEPTFTWADDPGNPTSQVWVNNGTFAGMNQSAVLSQAGTYTFSVTVDDGAGGVDTASVTFLVSAQRTFCVNSDRTFVNNVLPFDQVAPDVANWTFYEDADYSEAVGGTVQSVNYDGAAHNSVALNWAAHRDVTLPLTDSRYYMKFRVAKQHVDKRLNNDLKFWIFVQDADGNLLFSDQAIIRGSNLVTKRNADWSVTYGVASAYFSVSGQTNVRIYVMTDNRDGGRTYRTWLDAVYITPADVESDAIYQDLRLAIRHHKPNDLIQLAGTADGIFFDVPMRIAGKNIAFNITGGWDASSHNGAVYTSQDWTTYKSHLNYIRFAYFKRQRDWAYNAVSTNMYIYFPSLMGHFYVSNEWPDLPNAWAYDGMNMQLIMHAPVIIEKIKFSGLYRAGDITAYGDSVQQIDNKLTVRDIEIEDCLEGLRIRTEHIDLDVLDSTGARVTAGTFIIAAKRSNLIERNCRINGNSFTDCGVFSAIGSQAINRDDDVWRRMPSFTDDPKWAVNFSAYVQNPYWNVVYDPHFAPIAIVEDDLNKGMEPNFEIAGNTFRKPTAGREALYDIVFTGSALPQSRVRIHGNDSDSGKDFIGIHRVGDRWDYYCPEWPKFMTFTHSLVEGAIDWTQFADAAAAAAFLEANTDHYLAVYDNTLADMRSIVNFVNGSGFSEASPRGVPYFLLEDNLCTAVPFAAHFGAGSAMTPQGWDKIQTPGSEWYHIGNNGVGCAEKHITWNIMPGEPQATPLLHNAMCHHGVIPRQILAHFPRG